MSSKKQAIHPLAKRFPPMLDPDFAALKESIQSHGLQQPIILFDGMIVDGVHRLKACEEAGVKPTFREWKGKKEDLLEFLVACNLVRRHAPRSQKAMFGAMVMVPEAKKVVARLRKLRAKPSSERFAIYYTEQGELKGAHAAVATRLGISARYVYQAATIIEESKDLAQQVFLGKKSIPQAESMLKAQAQGEAVVKQMVKQKDAAGHKKDRAFAEVLYNECQDDEKWRVVCNRLDKDDFLRMATRLRWRLVGVK